MCLDEGLKVDQKHMYIKKIRLNAQNMGDIGLHMWAMFE
jgi:hypothetical protein